MSFPCFRLDDVWNQPRQLIEVQSVSDERDLAFSDSQLVANLQLPKWRWALFKIRAAALRFCRRKYTRSFFSYYWSILPASKRPPQLRKTSDSPLHRSSPMAWVLFQPMSRKRKRKEDGDMVEESQRYIWSSQGKKEYQRRWKDHRAYSAEVMRGVEVGVDCISRGANALWWDWHAGSTLSYWEWPYLTRCGPEMVNHISLQASSPGSDKHRELLQKRR